MQRLSNPRGQCAVFQRNPLPRLDFVVGVVAAVRRLVAAVHLDDMHKDITDFDDADVVKVLNFDARLFHKLALSTLRRALGGQHVTARRGVLARVAALAPQHLFLTVEDGAGRDLIATLDAGHSVC